MKEIGRRLKERREELGLSLAEVQAETKIRRRYLQALESGEEGLIPGEVYVKGFLRFYGNFLGLDGSALVRDYNQRREAQALDSQGSARRSSRRQARRGPEPRVPSPAEIEKERGTRPRLAARSGTPAPARSETPAPAREAAEVRLSAQARAGQPLIRPAKGRRRGAAGRLLVSVLVIVLLVVVAGAWYVWTQAPSPADGDTGVLPGGDDGTPPPGNGSDSSSGGDSEPPGDSQGPGDSGTGEPGDGEPAPGWALVGESGNLTRYVVYGAPFTIGLEVTAEKCWVEVKVDGQVVFVETLEAGAKGEWTARERVSIVFGRPHLVAMTVNGQSLGPAGTEDVPRTLTFEAGNPPGEGEGAGGA
ncbi:MAG: DUF4115 domain-containing protein [Bacillota bacterium]|nr:MAG: DUF4115 domain-containing protein [Bacillota bacterium]